MEIEIETAIELIAQSCLSAEEMGRSGAVSVVGLDPAGEIILPVRVRDDDWQAALSSVPFLVAKMIEQGHPPKLLLFGFGIGEVECLYSQWSLNVIANAVATVYENPDLDAGSSGDVEVIRALGEELETRNIGLTFIGDRFTAMFDRSKSTFHSFGNGCVPSVPVLNVAH